VREQNTSMQRLLAGAGQRAYTVPTSATPLLSVCGLMLLFKPLILSCCQTVKNFYQALIRLSRNLAQRRMRLDPHSHGLIWFYIPVDFLQRCLHIVKGRLAFIPPNVPGRDFPLPC
jgi:hypothetical protein